MMTSRTRYILPAVLLSVLAILIFSDVGNAQDVQSATGTVRGAVATKAPDGQPYDLPAASLKLKLGTQVAETTANDAGEYEFTKLLPRFSENYRFRLGAKAFDLTNHFNPRDFQGNLASDEFRGFYHGVAPKFGMKFVIEKK